MAIKTELLENDLVRTWSDLHVYIHGGFPEADYAEVIDPVSKHRTYVETDIPIPAEDDEEATIEDYQQALADVGVNLEGGDAE